MREKLISVFFKKDLILLLMTLVLFLAAGVCTEYCMIHFAANYYKWKPVKELKGNWYFYMDDYESDETVETYLRRKGAINVIDFRREHSPLKDPTDICFDDYYSIGVLWQASAEEVEMVQNIYPEAVDFRSVSQVLAEEDLCGNAKWWWTNLATVLAVWAAAIATGWLWFRRALRYSKKELDYLAYIGNNKKTLRKLYCNSLFLLVPIVWLFSFSAIVLPEPGGFEVLGCFGYRQIYLPIPVLMLVFVYAMVRLYFACCRNAFETNETIDNLFVKRGVRRIYLEDFTVEENLQLVLMAQGFSSGLALTLTKLEMRERQIEFCAKRPMAMCPGDEKLVFYDLQEEFMQRAPVGI